MGKDRVRKKLEQVAAAAGERARHQDSRLLGRWVQLHHRGGDSWFLGIDTPATVHDDTSRGDTRLDIACAVDAPLDRTLAVLDDPGDLLAFLNDPETDIRHPLEAAMVYELVHPGGIDRQLRALLGSVPPGTPTPTVEAFFDATLQRAGRAMNRRHPRVRVSFNVHIAGLGTRGLQVVDGTPVVTQEPLAKAKCDIRMDRAVLEAMLADPITAVAALVAGDLEVSSPCRARQLAMSLWHDPLEQLLPDDLYVMLYDPAASEFPSGGTNHHTYILFNGQAHKIAFTDFDGDGVVEGDIVIGRTEELLEVARRVEQQKTGPTLEGVVKRDWGDPSKYLWKNNTLYYRVDDGVEDPDRITDGIAMFSDVAVRFVEGEGDGDYVLIMQTDRSSSYVGRIGGQQILTLTAGASAGTVAHEFCHALGMWHEHQRYDRDTWVKIIKGHIVDWEKIKINFDQQLPSVNAYLPIEAVWNIVKTPPTSQQDKTRRWIVGTDATGDWKGHDNQIAQWEANLARWTFTDPGLNNLVRVLQNNTAWWWDGTVWKKVRTKTQDLGTYDYGSITHYPKTAFGKHKNSYKQETTIKALQPLRGKTMGQRRALSQSDKDTLNTLYKADSLAEVAS